MVIAQIGPLTAAVEALATAVGAGIVLGGFVLGVWRVLFGQPRRVREARVLTDGYVGGLSGVALVLIDMFIRYGA